MRLRQSLLKPYIPCIGTGSPGRRSGWELEFRDCGSIPGRGLQLTSERRMERRWGRKLWWEMPVEARQPWEQGNTAESCIAGGAVTIASLPGHTSIHSWTIERLAHQTPDALNYRVGPQPGRPFKCLTRPSTDRTPARVPLYVPDARNHREGPQTRGPSKCLHGRSYGERLAEEAFWSPATRG